MVNKSFHSITALLWMGCLLTVGLVVQQARGSGACCAVAKVKANSGSLAVIGSTAWSHEEIGGQRYNLTQQAILLKAAYPLPWGLVIQAQGGIPLATQLEHGNVSMSGQLGLIGGVGIGWSLPNFPRPVQWFVSGSFSRSDGNVDASDFMPMEQTLRITELQAMLIGEFDALSNLSVYAGVRAYLGRDELIDKEMQTVQSGQREGNFAPLLGLRWAVGGRYSVIAEGGFGHTTILSLGTILEV